MFFYRKTDVALCFDRFVTSVNLMKSISLAAVGTCMSNRKNLPIMTTKLKNRGDVEFKCSTTGVVAAKWKDTKEVLLVSNCHDANTV